MINSGLKFAKHYIMKLTSIFFTLFLWASLSAQHFNEQIYYDVGRDPWRPTTGVLANFNDTLAYIQFLGMAAGDNAYYACRYHFRNDSLFLDELTDPISFNKRVEYNCYKHRLNDTISLGYQVYYEGRGQAGYDSLFFEVNGIKYANTKQCDSHCTQIPRPKESEFTITIWNGKDLLESYDVTVSKDNTSIYMTKDIFNSWVSFGNLSQKRIPKNVSIDGVDYTLITHLIDRSDYLTPSLFMETPNGK